MNEQLRYWAHIQQCVREIQNVEGAKRVEFCQRYAEKIHDEVDCVGIVNSSLHFTRSLQGQGLVITSCQMTKLLCHRDIDLMVAAYDAIADL